MNDIGEGQIRAQESRNSISDVWGDRTPYFGEDHWPERIDQRTTGAPDQWVQSACVLCSNGCALDIGVAGGRMVGVRGRGIDPVNRGRLGPKGMHGWEANLSPERLTLPLLRKEDSLQPASWDEAMSLIVSRSKEIRDAFTASAIGFYTSGQLFLEEYYTLALIGKGGLGTPHMDGNTRLCTATAGESLKQHLAPRVGTNVALLNGLLHLLIAAGSIDRAFRWRSYWAGTSLLHCSW